MLLYGENARQIWNHSGVVALYLCLIYLYLCVHGEQILKTVPIHSLTPTKGVSFKQTLNS